MSKVLFDQDEILVINPKLAGLIGLNEAIIIQQIHYWIQNKSCAGVVSDGRKWVYNTIPQWREQFPFMSESTIKRAMLSLRDDGLIIVDKLSSDGRNHTNYYTINYEELSGKYAESFGSKWTGSQFKMNQSNSSKWNEPNNTETTTKNNRSTKADYSALFDTFWQAYPKKVAKDAAYKAFAKRKPDDKLLKDILQAVELQRVSEMWTKDGGQYIPNPATWLNQGRWMDEVEGVSGGSSMFVGAI